MAGLAAHISLIVDCAQTGDKGVLGQSGLLLSVSLHVFSLSVGVAVVFVVQVRDGLAPLIGPIAGPTCRPGLHNRQYTPVRCQQAAFGVPKSL